MSFLRKLLVLPKSAFSLTELMIAVGIVAVLAGVVLAFGTQTMMQVKVKVTMYSVKNFAKHIQQQRDEKGYWQDEQTIEGDAPTHAWGGAIRFRALDFDNDGVNETAVFMLDDDRPGTGHNDNQGTIPQEALEMFDDIFDDGNLSTGKIVGNGHSLPEGTNIVVGELAIFF